MWGNAKNTAYHPSERYGPKMDGRWHNGTLLFGEKFWGDPALHLEEELLDALNYLVFVRNRMHEMHKFLTAISEYAEDRPSLYLTLTGYGTSSIIPTDIVLEICLLYTSPSPRDRQKSRMPSSA